MSCKTYLYQGRELTESGLIQALAVDPKIVQSYMAQEEREGMDYELEDRQTFEKKVKALQESMNVEVIYDETVSTSRLLGKNDKRTKAAGKPVILINPNQLFKTTAIHEFAHVFIDAFPKGLDNPRIQKALKELEGTELWSEVKELYPELSEDMFHKEVLATAIGREGSDIWDNAEQASKWESFVAWFSDFLRRTFGLNRSEVVNLSNELLSDQVKAIEVTQLEEIAQELRTRRIDKEEAPKSKEEVEFETTQAKIEKTYNRLLGVVTKIYKNQQKNTESDRKRENDNVKAGKKTRLSSITSL
ncbi:MAG: hypothetical protein KUG81_07610, partial [Gammaproteobacteria bacterium]|nr:hypothetical protein [Gammaproteobacteria bacterium]